MFMLFFVCVVYIIDKKIYSSMAADLTNSILLQSTGRDYGPDFALDVKTPGFDAVTRIDENTSITQVLNIVGFLCNTTRTGADINEKHSIDKNIYGLHDVNGNYDVNGLAGAPGAPGAGAALDTLFFSAAVAGGPLFDLATMTAAAAGPAGAVVPQGLLKRDTRAAGAPPVVPDLYTAAAPLAVGNVAEVNNVMKDCISQMIKILEKTREVFGPKGWTALFKTVVGGKASKKRTHRRHRRRYSSKQY
jgi:hypothetical protein